MTNATPLASERLRAAYEEGYIAGYASTNPPDHPTVSDIQFDWELSKSAALSATPAPSDQDASQAQREVSREMLRARVHRALANIEDDTRLTDLTNAEMDTIIDAASRTPKPAPGATAQDGAHPAIAAAYRGLSSTPTPTIPAGMVADVDVKAAAELCADWEIMSITHVEQFLARHRIAAAPKQAEQQGVEIIARELWSILFGAVDFEQASDEWRGTIFDHAHRIAAALNAPTGAVEKGEAM